MPSKNTSYLAGEFLVAGELSRRGYPVSITMGNAKSVDILAEAKNTVIKIDAKAGRTKSNWPIRKESIQNNVYYIFVYLQSDSRIRDNFPPEYFVLTGQEINKKNMVSVWGTRQGIRYQTLKSKGYHENWDKLPPP